MSEEALQAISQVSAVAAPVGQGFSDRAAANQNAATLRTQAGQALASAAYDETRVRNNNTQIIARQTADAIANGSFEGGSGADVIRQNEVNTIADALAIRARGQIEAAGYESKAAAVKREGARAPYAGLAGAGSQLLSTAAARKRAALTVN